MNEPFDETLARHQSSKWILATGFMAGIVAPFLAYFHGTWRGWPTDAAIAAIAIVYAALRVRPVVTTTRVRADGKTLSIGEEVIPRNVVRRVLYVPRGSEHLVRVECKGRLTFDLLVESPADARRLLAAMALDAKQSVATFRVLPRGFGKTLANAMSVAMMLGAGLFALNVAPKVATFAAIAVLVLPLLLAKFVPAHVDIGPDGILHRWFGTWRFIPTKKIRSATKLDEGMFLGRRIGVKLELEGGELVEIVTAAGQYRGDDSAVALLGRIQEILGTSPNATSDGTLALLARGHKPVSDWIRGLKAFGAGASATLRIAPPDVDRLWALLESATATATERAAAAVALSASSEEGAKDRIRVAADAIAEPRLRVAVAEAAGEDEVALERALGALEE